MKGPLDLSGGDMSSRTLRLPPSVAAAPGNLCAPLTLATLLMGCQSNHRAPPQLGVSVGPAASEVAASSSAPSHATSRQLPLRFEVNRGQFDSRARFVARQGNMTLFLTDEGAVMAVRSATIAQGDRPEDPGEFSEPAGHHKSVT